MIVMIISTKLLWAYCWLFIRVSAAYYGISWRGASLSDAETDGAVWVFDSSILG